MPGRRPAGSWVSTSNRELLSSAAAHAVGHPNLAFELGDLTALGHGHGLDVITAARDTAVTDCGGSFTYGWTAGAT